MRKTKWLAALAACALALAATGCDDGFTEMALNAMKNNAEQNVPVTGVSITLNGEPLDNNTLTLKSGKSVTLTAEITPKNASDTRVTWQSSNESVATVDEDGTVTAKQVYGNRTVWITVTTVDGEHTATCMVTVMPRIAATGVTIEREDGVPIESDELTLMIGETLRLTAKVEPEDADDTVTWLRSYPYCITVDENGTVTANYAGTTTITARAGSVSATVEVTVTLPDVGTDFVLDNYGKLTDYTGSDTDVDIPEGVTGIEGSSWWDYGAFRGCTSLTSVELSEGVTSIGDEAFRGCTSLTSVEIPASVKSIGTHAFVECKSLTSVIYTGTLADWCGISWSNGAANPLWDGNAILYVGPSGEPVTDAEIPEGVTEIKDYAFYGYSHLTSVTIPASVTSIGEWAFGYCTGLKSVEIPGSVKSIGDYAFYWCENFKKIEFDGTVAQWKAIKGSDGVDVTCVQCRDGYLGVKEVPPYLTMSGATVTGYTDGEGITLPKNLTIPNGVKSIGENAFSDCTSLESVTIPEGVTRIENEAFYGCTNLTEITIPGSVTYIGGDRWNNYSGAFRGCTSLEKVIYTGTLADWCGIYWGYSFANPLWDGNAILYVGPSGEPVTEAVIPEGVTEIEDYAFYGYEKLMSVKIGNDVTRIGERAFYECSGLKSVEIPGSVTSIGYSAFGYCTVLKTITYEGTTDQWDNMDKDDNWAYGAGDFTIHCKGDGKTLDKNGNVIEQ